MPNRPDLTPHCPHCNVKFDQRIQASGPVETGKPETHDLCICGYCGEISIRHHGKYNIPTDDDILQIDPLTLSDLKKAKLNIIRAATMLNRDDTLPTNLR